MNRLLLITLILTLSLLGAGNGLADEIWLDITGNTVTLHHSNAQYHCAAEVDLEVQFFCTAIAAYEIDLAEWAAYCICRFDLEFEFDVPEAGDYTLVLFDLVGVPIAEFQFTIDEVIDFRPLITVAQSDCGGWVTGIPEGSEESIVWSTLKALY
ncbi:MAG: hypothetical protein GY835_14790 [bacterium]|nr:hypothetical protein [bacterium]